MLEKKENRWRCKHLYMPYYLISQTTVDFNIWYLFFHVLQSLSCFTGSVPHTTVMGRRTFIAKNAAMIF